MKGDRRLRLLLFQMSKSVNNVQELGMLANSMTRDYSALAGDCRGAVAASANPQVSLSITQLKLGSAQGV